MYHGYVPMEGGGEEKGKVSETMQPRGAGACLSAGPSHGGGSSQDLRFLLGGRSSSGPWANGQQCEGRAQPSGW